MLGDETFPFGFINTAWMSTAVRTDARRDMAWTMVQGMLSPRGILPKGALSPADVCSCLPTWSGTLWPVKLDLSTAEHHKYAPKKGKNGILAAIPEGKATKASLPSYQEA